MPTMNRLLLASCALTLASLTACDRGRPDAEAAGATEVEAQGELPADFAAFYERFHADSAFQLAHVTFPLEGRVLTDSTDGSAVEGRHAREDWVLHRPLALGEDFAREVEVLDDGLVFETIRARAGDYAIRRRFARVGGEWNLIFYRESRL